MAARPRVDHGAIFGGPRCALDLVLIGRAEPIQLLGRQSKRPPSAVVGVPLFANYDPAASAAGSACDRTDRGGRHPT